MRDLETTKEQLGLLGVDPDHPTGIVERLRSGRGNHHRPGNHQPVGRAVLSTPNPFTISDLSQVWIICDVWENNMSQVHIGEYRGHSSGRLSGPRAERRESATSCRSWIPTSAPPRCGWKWRIPASCGSGCSSPRRSTAERRKNMRPCRPPRFCTCTTASGSTRRWETAASGAWKWSPGDMLPGNMQEVVSGIKPGDQVVLNALVFQNTVEQ